MRMSRNLRCCLMHHYTSPFNGEVAKPNYAVQSPAVLNTKWLYWLAHQQNALRIQSPFHLIWRNLNKVCTTYLENITQSIYPDHLKPNRCARSSTSSPSPRSYTRRCSHHIHMCTISVAKYHFNTYVECYRWRDWKPHWPTASCLNCRFVVPQQQRA